MTDAQFQSLWDVLANVHEETHRTSKAAERIVELLEKIAEPAVLRPPVQDPDLGASFDASSLYRPDGRCACRWNCHAAGECSRPRDPSSNVCILCSRAALAVGTARNPKNEDPPR